MFNKNNETQKNTISNLIQQDNFELYQNAISNYEIAKVVLKTPELIKKLSIVEVLCSEKYPSEIISEIPIITIMDIHKLMQHLDSKQQKSFSLMVLSETKVAENYLQNVNQTTYQNIATAVLNAIIQLKSLKSDINVDLWSQREIAPLIVAACHVLGIKELSQNELTNVDKDVNTYIEFLCKYASPEDIMDDNPLADQRQNSM